MSKKEHYLIITTFRPKRYKYFKKRPHTKQVIYDSETGTFEVKYTDGETYEVPEKFVRDIQKKHEVDEEEVIKWFGYWRKETFEYWKMVDYEYGE